jgi:hypothetical protein
MEWEYTNQNEENCTASICVQFACTHTTNARKASQLSKVCEIQGRGGYEADGYLFSVVITGRRRTTTTTETLK